MRTAERMAANITRGGKPVETARPTLAEDLLYGRAIEEARRRRGKRQSEVAVAAGISIRTYQDYERGRMSIPLLRRPLIAQAVGLDPALLGIPPDPAPVRGLDPLPPEEAAWLALYGRLPAWARTLFRRWTERRARLSVAEEAASC